MGDQWDGGPLGLAENGWTNEKGDQWEGGPMSSNDVVGDLWIGAPMRRGPMRWGTNEMGDQWVGGTNEMGDQWNEWCMGANWGINEMGDQWDGGPMRWGTNEMGDQWDGGPMMCTHSVDGSNSWNFDDVDDRMRRPMDHSEKGVTDRQTTGPTSPLVQLLSRS